LKRKPKVLQALHNSVIGYECVWPGGLVQLFFAHEPAAVFDQVPEHLERFWPQLYFTSLPQQAAARQVQSEITE
jgi:hypothetical protein